MASTRIEIVNGVFDVLAQQAAVFRRHVSSAPLIIRIDVVLAVDSIGATGGEHCAFRIRASHDATAFDMIGSLLRHSRVGRVRTGPEVLTHTLDRPGVGGAGGVRNFVC